MPQNNINNHIQNLQRQIADVVGRIKGRQESKNLAKFCLLEEYFSDNSSKVENQAYKLMSAEASYSLLKEEQATDSSYAAETYDFVSNADKRTTVVEGLYFENNKEFDFKV